MPKKVHDALKREAHKKGLTGDKADRYVYGGLFNYVKKTKGEAAAKSEISGHHEPGNTGGSSEPKSQPEHQTKHHPGHHVTGSGHHRGS